MYVPAGIRMRSFSTYGNVVSAYTGSPSRAFLVEIACFRLSGILVPAGITTECDSAADFSEIEGLAVCGPTGEISGLFTVSTCPQAIPDTSSSIQIARILHLRRKNYSTGPSPLSSEITTAQPLGCSPGDGSYLRVRPKRSLDGEILAFV